MTEDHLPIYQTQDFDAREHKEKYFYMSSFAAHLQKHLFIQKPHKHDFFILLLITKGTGSHTIDFKEYAVVPGTMFFLSPGQVHSWDLSADTDGFIVFFTAAFYLLEFPHKKLNSFPFFNMLLNEPLLSLANTAQDMLLNIMQHMQQEHLQAQLMKDDIIRDYLDILLIQLKRVYQEHSSENKIPATFLPQLQAFDHLIDKHY